MTSGRRKNAPWRVRLGAQRNSRASHPPTQPLRLGLGRMRGRLTMTEVPLVRTIFRGPSLLWCYSRARGVMEILQPSARWGLGITPPGLERPIPPYLRAIMVDLSSVKHTTLAKDIMDERDAHYRAQFD